jgi:microcystin-dependent protein
MPVQNPYIVESPSLENLFRDKDSGLPLANGVVKWFADSGGRNVLKDIYQQVRQPDGTYTYVTLPNPLTLSSIGTYADNDGNDINVYLWPYTGAPTDTTPGPSEKYYIEVYSAAPPISNSALQFTRENWPPNTSGNNPTDFFEGTENQLANPQFVEVNFVPNVGATTYTFSVTGAQSTLIAPDWYIDTNGTGTVIVEQINDVDTSATSNPPYALYVDSTGVTSLTLRQRIVHSPRLFSTNYVSASLQAASEDASPITLNMSMGMSSGGAPIEFFSLATTADGTFTTLEGTKQITNLNTDPATTGYVDITVEIPPARKVQITSLQIVQVQNLQSSTQFLQESTPRQIDHLYHYAYPIVPIGAIIDFAGFTAPLHYLLCDGTAYNRITYQQLFRALTTTETVSLTNTVATFTVVSAAKYYIGMAIEGTGIPAATTISNIVGTTITMSAAATATQSSLVTFFAWGDGNGSTTFNVPNLSDYVTAGANGTMFASGRQATGYKGGANSYTLVANDLPAHTHAVATGAASGVGGASRLASGTGAGTTGNNTTTNQAISLIQQTALVYKYIRYE